MARAAEPIFSPNCGSHRMMAGEGPSVTGIDESVPAMCRPRGKLAGGIAQLAARRKSGDAFAQGQLMHLAVTLPFTVEHGEMQFLVPLALEQRVFAIMRL